MATHRAFAVSRFPVGSSAEAAATNAEGTPRSVETSLRALRDLLDKGLITQEDFEARKKELLRAI